MVKVGEKTIPRFPAAGDAPVSQLRDTAATQRTSQCRSTNRECPCAPPATTTLLTMPNSLTTSPSVREALGPFVTSPSVGVRLGFFL